MDACPICLEGVEKIPWEERLKQGQIFPLPCKKHGDPRILHPENEIAVSMYAKMFPGNLKMLEIEDGEKIRREFYLDLSLIKQLCAPDAFDCDFLETLHKLEIIHKIWQQ